MSKMIGNSEFVYDDAGKKILGVGSPDGTMSNFIEQFTSLSAIPAGFVGTAQVGTQLYVGDGVSLISTSDIYYNSLGSQGGYNGFTGLASGQALNGTPFTGSGFNWTQNGGVPVGDQKAAIDSNGKTYIFSSDASVHSSYGDVQCASAITRVDQYFSNTVASATITIAFGNSNLLTGSNTLDLIHVNFTDGVAGTQTAYASSTTPIVSWGVNNGSTDNTPTTSSALNFHDGLIHKITVIIFGNFVLSYADSALIGIDHDANIGTISKNYNYAFAQFPNSTYRLYGMSCFSSSYTAQSGYIDTEAVTARAVITESLRVGHNQNVTSSYNGGSNFVVNVNGNAGAIITNQAAGGLLQVISSQPGYGATFKVRPAGGDYGFQVVADNSGNSVISAGTGQAARISLNSNGASAATVFADVIFPKQAASAPTYVIGGVYFDTSLKKLRIGGASAWETVTSV